MALNLQGTHYAADENGTPKAHNPGETFLTTGSETLSQTEWLRFHKRRQQLLRSSLTLRLPEGINVLEGEGIETFAIPLIDHPSWIAAKRNSLGVHATVDTLKLRRYLEREIAPLLRPVSHLRILALPGEGESRASMEGDLSDGWRIESAQAARDIARGVSRGLLSFTLPVQRVQAEVRNETGRYLGEFRLLARGRSNFVGSVPNRIFNIHKALTEHVSHVLIPPRGTFDFNGTLGGPVEVRNGWKLSLGIFGNGATLAPTPGGGICQASTTTFRALAAAGLPIEERSNHSMYIKYYRQFGEGLDAAVFPGSKNLIARNDTPGYILFHGHTDGDDAYVDIYGTPDGRRVSLEGPFRWYDAPEDIALPEGRRPWPREIVWRQRIDRVNGATEENTFRSYYMTDIPDEAPALAGEVQIILGDESVAPTT